jgi:hypothetical protein
LSEHSDLKVRKMELRYKIIFSILVSLLILSMGVSHLSPTTAFATPQLDKPVILPPQLEKTQVSKPPVRPQIPDYDGDGLLNSWEQLELM